MTEEQKLEFEHRLTETEARSKSNTRRIDEHDEKLKENSDLIRAIEKLATETKYMREDINDLTNWKKKMESKDDDKWEKFKWLIVAGLVTIVLGYLAVSVGLK